MRKQCLTGAFYAGIFSLCLSTTTSAALLGRLPATPGGTDYQAYYDTTLGITWIADANLAASNTFGLPNNTDLGMHPDDNYPGTYNNQILTDGRMTWGAALHWIDAVNNSNGGSGYLGFNDWRLPDVLQPDPSCGAQFVTSAGLQSGAYNCTGSELGNLFYVTLGATAGTSILTASNTSELAKFTNVQSAFYWTGLEYAAGLGRAWDLNTRGGSQDAVNKATNYLYAWAVRSGDVSAVPVPAAIWLFGSGLLGLVGMARRKC